MSDSNVNNPQDGFDAIEYPLDFPFKAVCQTTLTESDLIDALTSSIHQNADHLQVKSVSSKQSSTGKYISITLLIHIASRSDLESVYNALSSNKEVKMTL